MACFWDAGDSRIALYVDASDRDTLAKLTKFRPAAVYERGGKATGFHYLLNEGVTALARFGVGKAPRLA